IAGKNTVVVGRSDIVGKPAAMMLLNASATVTVCHSRTVDLPKFTREAEILVAAIGRPGFITAEMVKPGATLIDVGINRVSDAAGRPDGRAGGRQIDRCADVQGAGRACALVGRDGAGADAAGAAGVSRGGRALRAGGGAAGWCAGPGGAGEAGVRGGQAGGA